jgi:hypothetical protein
VPCHLAGDRPPWHERTLPVCPKGQGQGPFASAQLLPGPSCVTSGCDGKPSPQSGYGGGWDGASLSPDRLASWTLSGESGGALRVAPDP